MYARLSALEASSGDADDGTVADLTGEQAPGPLEFTVASRVQYRLDLSEGGTLREYIPVHFDGGHFVKLDAMVHASLQHIKHRPALRRRGSAPLVIAAATGSSNSASSSSASSSSAALSASGRRKSADTAVNGSSSNSSSGGAAGRSSANSSVNSTRPAVPVKEESAWGIFSKLLTGVTASTDQPKSSTAASSSRPYTATAAAAQQENSVSPFWTTYLLRVPKSATAALIGSGYSDWGFGSSSSATGSSHSSSSSSLASSGQLSRHNSSTLQRRESCTGGTSAAGLELRVGMYHCFVAPMAAALEGVSASATTTLQRVVTKVVWCCVLNAALFAGRCETLSGAM
jgi:Protein FAM135